METIIVTGGAGYIGSHTIIELLEKTNYRVVSLDNFSNSTDASYRRIKEITGKTFETVEVDLCDKDLLFEELSSITGVSGIIHFAAYKSVPESVENPLAYYNNNIGSLLNILEFAKSRAVKNFIFSSSCSVYGNADALPVTESTPLKKPESAYAHTKQMGEDMIGFLCRSMADFNAVLLRYFNPVGAHMSGNAGEAPLGRPNNLVPIITQTAVGLNRLTVYGNDYDTRDGSCIRDYIHVSDIAGAHVKALEYLSAKKNRDNLSLFNLGTGNGVSVLEAIHSFERVSGRKLDYTIGDRRAGDVVAVYADNSLAQKVLGWTPHYSIDDMMLSAWKWQQKLEKERLGG